MSDLIAIISRTIGATPLRRRRAKETLRSVYRVDGFIVKEFDIPAKCRHYRRPWRIEAAALGRMGDDYPGAALGTVERVEDGVRKVFFVKRFMEGTPLESIDEHDIPGIARLLAEIHARGVVTDDAHTDNFLRTQSGDFAFIDFGRAMVLRCRPAPALAIGKELAKLYREGFEYDRKLFRAFMCEYCSQAHASDFRRFAISLGVRTAVFFRNLRKGRGK